MAIRAMASLEMTLIASPIARIVGTLNTLYIERYKSRIEKLLLLFNGQYLYVVFQDTTV